MKNANYNQKVENEKRAQGRTKDQNCFVQELLLLHPVHPEVGDDWTARGKALFRDQFGDDRSKALSLTVCAWCKKDLGFSWVDACSFSAWRVSHGMCRECLEEMQTL